MGLERPLDYASGKRSLRLLSNSMVEVMPGAEPFSAAGGPMGALVIHGFTGSPQSMRPLAESFAAAGFSVELPRLPGHGTSVEDMLTTSWQDWSAAVEEAYRSLAARCERVVVAGLSMGGTLTLWLATRHPGIAGIVPINAALLTDPQMVAQVRAGIEAGQTTTDAVGGDVADPGVKELAYDRTPLRPLASLFEALGELPERLDRIRCPVLIVVSEQDHIVSPASSHHIAAAVAGPVEKLVLRRSFHVATIDYDKAFIAERAIAFARSVCSGSRGGTT